MAAALAHDRDSEEHGKLLGGGAPFAGKYGVERILGHGGMGTVFEARHLRLGHRVAIKVLGSELRDYPELVTRFEREARAAGSLTSRHAVRVFDIDMTEDATPFIVMELLSGSDLARILEGDGAQPVPLAVKWVVEACDAIAEAHRLGIIHRDIKPSNLFLTKDGVKVLDFGIAKRVASKEASITHAVAPLGTPQYMSPEQVRCAKDVDARTDVWSLGVTLYELVTGRTPFAHEIPQACIASIAADPVPDPRTFAPELPSAFVAVLMRALAKDPKSRQQSVEELVTELAPFAEKGADGAPTDSVRRVVGEAEKALRSGESTLDGELVELESVIEDNDLFESGVRRPPTFARAQRAQAELHDKAVADENADESVPPAVTRVPLAPSARVPGRRRVWTSRLGIASAAVLGLVALVVTPRCVASLDAPSTAVVRASAPTTTPPTIATPPAATVDGMPKPDVARAAEAQAPAPAAPPAVVPAVLPAVLPAAATPTPAPPPKKPSTPSTRPSPKRQELPPRLFQAESPVHGGLSNPGL